MIGEMNDPEQPLVTINLPPFKKAKILSRIEGPCHFGHKHTSARDLNGTPCWFQVPIGITWNGAKPGDTLCNACIVKLRRRQHECEPCDDDPDQAVVAASSEHLSIEIVQNEPTSNQGRSAEDAVVRPKIKDTINTAQIGPKRLAGLSFFDVDNDRSALTSAQGRSAESAVNFSTSRTDSDNMCTPAENSAAPNARGCPVRA